MKIARVMFFVMVLNLQCSAHNLFEDEEKKLAQWHEDCKAIKLASPMFSVAVCVINQNNQVLLGKFEQEDLWSVPMAWMRSDDENLQACAQRVVAHETGLYIEELQDYALFDGGYAGIVFDGTYRESEHIMIFQYLAKNVHGQIQQGLLLKDRDWLHSYQQYSCWQWFDKDDLPESIDWIGFSKEELLEILN